MIKFNSMGKRKPKKRDSNNLLMHFDGTPGSKIFKDEYPDNGDIYSLGNPILTNEQSKFGGSSGKFINESLALELPITLVCDETTPGQPAFCPLAVMNSGGQAYIARWISSINPNPLTLAAIT